MKQTLTLNATMTLIHAFISSRRDYCNGLLAAVSSQLLQKLQVIQNAAARLVTGARRCVHMTPVLRDLHWLPRQRFWHTSVSTAWLRSIYSPAAGLRQRVPVAVICALHSLVNGWFHEQQQNTATAVSPFKVLELGTVCRLNCKFQTLLRKTIFRQRLKKFLFDTRDRTASAFAALFNRELALYKCP